MSSRKRKQDFYARTVPGGGGVVSLYTKPYARPYKKRRMFVPGRDRVGGYYGRYATRDGELKFFDATIDDAIVAQGFVVQNSRSINAIPQGVTESQRVGRKCTIKSIHCHYEVKLPAVDAAATPGNADVLRVVIYLDKQTNGATIAGTDLFEFDDWQSFRNLANSGRFHILYDKFHALTPPNLASDGAGVVSHTELLRDFSFNKKCNIPIEFSSTTGAISEIRSNNIGLMIGSRTGLAGFSSEFKVRFSDN